MKKVISSLLVLILVMSTCLTAFADTTSENEITENEITENEITENEITENEITENGSSTAAKGLTLAGAGANTTSASQITNSGGSTTADGVTISKTIAGTDIENVFDITLKVTTQTDISEITKDPDVAVVIVMDISNTMDATFGDTTRYEAARQASNAFVNQFRSDVGAKSDTSKIGFVAFNSNSTQIAPMTEVKTTTQATNFKNTIKNGCDRIIYASGYAISHTRFTNIESGLKRGYNMIKNLPNQNKFILFLSDGFPTTYIKSDSTYDGCDPYTPDATSYSEGVFYDGYYKIPCSYGTSYSDRAAVKAREMATTIKNAGVTIFSVGVDVGSQTIEGYDTRSTGFSVIDRPKSARDNNKYEIGTKNSGFTNWLKGSATNNSVGIGSGYYYNSKNQTEITNAFTSIFNEMKTKTEERAAKAWQVKDPMGTNLEFIGFYDKNGTLQSTSTNLSGSFGAAKENTAAYTSSSKTFNWNLQKSGYSLSSGTYTFTLKYRVRLTNEAASGFSEGTSYNTNGTTTLTYQMITTIDGNPAISDIKTLNYKIPKVKGYLSELTFSKVDQYGRPLQGAVFKLEHDTDNCKTCKGSNPNTYVAKSGNLNDKTATSDANGTIRFTNIPSGHKYKLTETSAPAGYEKDSGTYHVTVAYDVLTTDLTDNTITDPQDLYEIQIKKIDGTTQQETVLPGAKFGVYSDAACETPATHPDGTVIGEVTTGADGKASLGILDFYKSYYLKEIEAPAGYDPLTAPIVITITPNASSTSNLVTAYLGTSQLVVTLQESQTSEQQTEPVTEQQTIIYTVTVTNNPGVKLPSTGGSGTLPYTLSGLMLLISFALMYGFRMRHRERRIR